MWHRIASVPTRPKLLVITATVSCDAVGEIHARFVIPAGLGWMILSDNMPLLLLLAETVEVGINGDAGVRACTATIPAGGLAGATSWFASKLRLVRRARLEPDVP